MGNSQKKPRLVDNPPQQSPIMPSSLNHFVDDVIRRKRDHSPTNINTVPLQSTSNTRGRGRPPKHIFKRERGRPPKKAMALPLESVSNERRVGRPPKCVVKRKRGRPPKIIRKILVQSVHPKRGRGRPSKKRRLLSLVYNKANVNIETVKNTETERGVKKRLGRPKKYLRVEDCTHLFNQSFLQTLLNRLQKECGQDLLKTYPLLDPSTILSEERISYLESLQSRTRITPTGQVLIFVDYTLQDMNFPDYKHVTKCSASKDAMHLMKDAHKAHPEALSPSCGTCNGTSKNLNKSCFPSIRWVNVSKGNKVIVYTTKKARAKLGYRVQYECPPTCPHGEECMNRNLEKGTAVPLAVFREANGKGWSLRSLVDIAPETFVCQYIGKIQVDQTVNKQKSVYDWTLSLPHVDKDGNETHLVIASGDIGNESRFANHSCDSNMVGDTFVPYGASICASQIGFVTTKSVEAGEELTLDYFPKSAGEKKPDEVFTYCLCGVSNCRYKNDQYPKRKLHNNGEKSYLQGNQLPNIP